MKKTNPARINICGMNIINEQSQVQGMIGLLAEKFISEPMILRKIKEMMSVGIITPNATSTPTTENPSRRLGFGFLRWRRQGEG